MPLTMALKCHIPTVHVLNNGDVALGGRRHWCWSFLKQTKYLLQLIAINNQIEIYLILLLYQYNPDRRPAALTRLLLAVDCCFSVFVAFWPPGERCGGLRPPGAATRPKPGFCRARSNLTSTTCLDWWGRQRISGRRSTGFRLFVAA